MFGWGTTPPITTEEFITSGEPTTTEEYKASNLVELSWIIPLAIWGLFLLLLFGVFLYWLFSCRFLGSLDRCLKRGFGRLEFKLTANSDALRRFDQPLTQTDSDDDEEISFLRASVNNRGKYTVMQRFELAANARRKGHSTALLEQHWHRSEELESLVENYYSREIQGGTSDGRRAFYVLQELVNICQNKIHDQQKQFIVPSWLGRWEISGELAEETSSFTPYKADICVSLDLTDVPHEVNLHDRYLEHATINITATSELLNFTKYRNMLSPSLLRTKLFAVLQLALNERFPKVEAYFSEKSGRAGYVSIHLWQDEDGYCYGIKIGEQLENMQVTVYQLFPVNIVAENSTYYFTDCEYIEAAIYPGVPLQPLHLEIAPSQERFPRGLPINLVAKPYLGSAKHKDDVNTELLWKLEFAQAEMREIKNSPVGQRLMSILLKLRETHSSLLPLSPCHFKTAVLHVLKEQDTSTDTLTQLLLKVVKQLQLSLAPQGKLPHFFQPELDLLEPLYRDQLYSTLTFLRTAFQSKEVFFKMLKVKKGIQ